MLITEGLPIIGRLPCASFPEAERVLRWQVGYDKREEGFGIHGAHFLWEIFHPELRLWLDLYPAWDRTSVGLAQGRGWDHNRTQWQGVSRASALCYTSTVKLDEYMTELEPGLWGSYMGLAAQKPFQRLCDQGGESLWLDLEHRWEKLYQQHKEELVMTARWGG